MNVGSVFYKIFSNTNIIFSKSKHYWHPSSTVCIHFIFFNKKFYSKDIIVFAEAPRKALLISFRVEGTMWHGYPLLEEARSTVDKWNMCDEGAARYDRKIAGSHFVVYYPLGKSLYNGTEVDNGTIAKEILLGLEASGNISMPSTLLNFVDGVDNTNEKNAAWRLEFLSDTGARQSSFVDRLRYLDSLKARAMHIPERAILEGQFGTKAEAQGHGDIMTVLLENLDCLITQEINYQLVNQLLELNFGPEMIDQVWLESSPLSDDKIMAARATFNSMLMNPNGFMEMFPQINYSSMMDELEIPKNKDVLKQGPNEQAVAPATPQQLQQMQKSNLTPQQLGLVNKLGLKPNQPQPLNRLAGVLRQQGSGPNGNPIKVPLNPSNASKANVGGLERNSSTPALGPVPASG
jgi:hypothetical protein